MVDRMIDKAADVWKQFSQTRENQSSGFSARGYRILGMLAALAAIAFALGLQFGPDIGSYFFHK